MHSAGTPPPGGHRARVPALAALAAGPVTIAVRAVRGNPAGLPAWEVAAD